MKSITGGAIAALFVMMTIAAAQQPQRTGLRIRVIEGEDAVNIVQQKTAVRPLVEVHDTNDQPVAGVIVQFAIRRVGTANTASFANGQSVLTVTTDVAGRAASPPLQAIGSGAVRIDIQASYQGQTASVTVNQTNYPTVDAATQAGRTPTPTSGAAPGPAPVPPETSKVPVKTPPSSVAATIAGVSAAGVTGALAVKESTQAGSNCSSYSISFSVDLDAALDACVGESQSSPQCTNVSQRAADSLGAWCSCQGGGGVDAQLKAENTSLALLRTLAGFPRVTFPGSCSQ